MSDELVPLEVADFLLYRLMGQIQLTKELNAKVGELKAAIDQNNKHWIERLEITNKQLEHARSEVSHFHQEAMKRFERSERRKERIVKNKVRRQK